MTTIEKIEKYQVVVVVRTDTPEEAYETASACIAGGIKLIEITFSVPDAQVVISKIATEHPLVTLGAGTVLSVKQASAALEAGALFVVSPHLDPEVVRFVKSHGAVSVPAAATPTEIMAAHHAGADIVKLFPFVEMGGLGFLKTIRGPLPFVKYMPSGGVTLQSLGQYLEARPSGIIVGSAIVKKDLVKACDWQAITGLAQGFSQSLPD